jgi:hypothetical protein
MDNDNDTDYSADARGRGDNSTQGGDWGAKDSLRRNAGLGQSAEEEVTPLIADGASSSARESGDGSSATAWNGNADFEGLGWWQRPSVCSQLRAPCVVLTGAAVLAIAALPPFRPGIRGTDRSETQSYIVTRMSRVSLRKIGFGPALHLRSGPPGLR